MPQPQWNQKTPRAHAWMLVMVPGEWHIGCASMHALGLVYLSDSRDFTSSRLERQLAIATIAFYETGRTKIVSYPHGNIDQNDILGIL
jgi:hypothetical protein